MSMKQFVVSMLTIALSAFTITPNLDALYQSGTAFPQAYYKLQQLQKECRHPLDLAPIYPQWLP